ncbi:MAG: Ribosome-recycling factor [Candidatus Amesbacteria bacterium GW2011_GWA2_42_12]|uniref:Ribosome-recycling factor n=1 Tax=Candidatus Amesbacteria bacterium GW2011_GWA2_42_12 TaxID=1618356 RepID=A0A0G0Y8J3_9BACT|nr:MAG: Ribosome-recycling factor [Candidatus Amesbacteria bacterium GW2011_GWA2_42_12]
MDLEEVKQKMQKLVEFVKNDVASIRTGRANSSLVDNIVINAYGGTAKMKVIEVAQVMVPDAGSITITPYDQSIIGDIRRDIEAANVGLTPVIDNNLIRIAVPSLTSERRLEYVKMLHVKLEDGRVKVRQIRHEKMGELKREFEEKKITEDDRRSYEDDLQKITDAMMGEIENIGKAKEAELMVI